MNDEKDLTASFEDHSIPSYAESVASHPAHLPKDAKAHMTKAQAISAAVAKVHEERVHDLVTSIVEPLLISQAREGLMKRTFALIPSDIDTLQSPKATTDVHEDVQHDEAAEKVDEVVVGFPEDEHVSMVRLAGPENIRQFWSQPDVIRRLDAELRSRLGIAKPYQKTDITQSIDTAAPPLDTPTKRRFFGRRKTGSSVKASSANQVLEQQQADSIVPEEMTLQLTLEEFWLRRPTEMGLYETKSGMALIIRVHMAK